MEGVMTMFKARANSSGTRPRARTAARSLDREIAITRGFVAAAAFTLTLAAVLAHIGS
jgi:hypothetical protein